MNQENINVDDLKKWIGNNEVVTDEVSQGLEKRFRATLDIDPGEPISGQEASSGIHWALAPAVVKSSLLGKDSHPTKGGFLPPVSLPRRMWAGCETEFFSPLFIGDIVTKNLQFLILILKKENQVYYVLLKLNMSFL